MEGGAVPDTDYEVIFPLISVSVDIAIHVLWSWQHRHQQG
jgi:hypothetical protein